MKMAAGSMILETSMGRMKTGMDMWMTSSDVIEPVIQACRIIFLLLHLAAQMVALGHMVLMWQGFCQLHLITILVLHRLGLIVAL